MVLMELDYSTIVRSFDNPVKAKIIATLHNNGPLTPKGLLIHLKNMPQATLYRQIRALESDGLLEVVHEEKKRAVVERTYDLSKILQKMTESVTCRNDVNAYMAIVRETFTILSEKFDGYSDREGADIIGDGSHVKYVPIYATREEMDGLIKDIFELIIPFMKPKSVDQRKHLVGCIVTPSEEVEWYE